MAQKIGTDRFFRTTDLVPPDVICADCAHNNCENCKFKKECGHVHYWDRWLGVAQIEEAYPNLRWNARYGVWEDSAAV
jgi:hypothetical protein